MGLEQVPIEIQIVHAIRPLVGELFDVAVHEGGHVGDIALHACIQEAGGGGEEAAHLDFFILLLVVVPNGNLHKRAPLLVVSDKVERFGSFGC